MKNSKKRQQDDREQGINEGRKKPDTCGGRRIGDQHRDASKARLIWGSSRHHGCANYVVLAASSPPVLVTLLSSLFSLDTRTDSKVKRDEKAEVEAESSGCSVSSLTS